MEAIKCLGTILTLFTWKQRLLSLISLAGGECVIFIPWYLTSDHVLCLNNNGVEELFKMAFYSGSWWVFRMLELQPTWGLLKWRSVKQSVRIMRPHVLKCHPHHPFVNMIILANSRVEIIVFNLLVECAAEWVKWTMRTWWSPAVIQETWMGILIFWCLLPVCHCFLEQDTLQVFEHCTFKISWNTMYTLKTDAFDQE